MIKVGYKTKLDEARKKGLPIPEPPKLSQEIMDEARRRYIYVFERITGQKF